MWYVPLSVKKRPLTNELIVFGSNYVAFNIWSACRYQRGFAEAPMHSDLTSACKNASVDVQKSLLLTIPPGALGIDVPVWAKVHIQPGEGTFDMHTAIMLAGASILCFSADML